MIRAVLDTSVLFSATLRDTLLRTAEARHYTPFWSPDITRELSESLVRHKRATPEKASYLVGEMNGAFVEASVSEFGHLLDRIENHPKDRHVVAAAIAANAEIIVTSNIRHFPSEVLGPHGIASVTPDIFLCSLLAKNRMNWFASSVRRPPGTGRRQFPVRSS